MHFIINKNNATEFLIRSYVEHLLCIHKAKPFRIFLLFMIMSLWNGETWAIPGWFYYNN